MDSNQNFSLDYLQNNQEENIEIDLMLILETLFRNKGLILKLGFFSLIFASIIALNSKRVWKGEFQIVLESNQDIAPIINSPLKSIAGIETNNNNRLETQVEILKSPSVLMNIFEFIKSEKLLKKNNSFQKKKFKDWREDSLSIKLEENTTILNISYKDTDKKLILPVLDKISKTYQNYAVKKRKRNLELGEKYFINQIEKYKEKSFLSSSKAQQYAIDQDISILKDPSSIDKEIINFVNIEAIRVDAASDLKIINEYLDIINNLEKGSEEILYIASTIPNYSSEILNLLSLKNIYAINSEISSLRLIFQEKDISIQNKLNERQDLIDQLKKEILGILNAKKLDAISRINASERPKGVIIKYKQILSEAEKDKITLSSLEQNYRNLLLEKAQTKDPWELITNPTLLPNPVAPQRKIIAIIGLMTGIFAGSVFVLLKNKLQDIVFSVNEIKSRYKFPIIQELFINNDSSLSESLNLFLPGSLSNLQGPIVFLEIGKINKNNLDSILDKINNLDKNLEIYITNNLIDAIKYPNLFLIAELGTIKRKEINAIINKIGLQKKSILGLLLINQEERK